MQTIKTLFLLALLGTLGWPLPQTSAAPLPPEALTAWRTVDSPTTNTLNGIHHTNGLFVSVGSRGTIITSPDGVLWTPRTSGTTNHLRAVTYDLGRWVACGVSVILHSTDAVTWTNAPIASLPAGRSFLSVRYGNGQFVALTSTGAAFSTNGTAWSYLERVAPFLESLTFGAGKFVAVRGDFFTGSEIFTSTNGLDWLVVTNYDSFLNLGSVTYTGGKFFATGANGFLLTSVDGSAWHLTIAAPTCQTGCQSTYDVAYGDGTYLLVTDYAFWVSENPPVTGWPQVSLTPCFSKRLAFGQGTFVAVGNNGCISIPASVYWTNTLGGNWSDAANWRPNRVPGTNDDAMITAEGTYTVTVNAAVKLNSLTAGATSGTQTVSVVEIAGLDLSGYGYFSSRAVLALNAGGISGAGEIVLDAPLVWSAGEISGPGVLNANGGMTISGTGAKSLSQRTVNNGGTVTWTGGNLYTYAGPVFNNLAGSLFDVQIDTGLSPNALPVLTFNNTGSFRKSAGAGASDFSGVIFNNKGTIDVQSGTIIFNNSFNQTSGSTLLKGGRMTSGNTFPTLPIRGGLLGGSGPVLGNLSMSGQLSPGLSAGRVEVTGNYAQAASGSYNVELGGTIAGTNYDQVIITGSATLAGTINVISLNGFVPAPGQRFEIMKFASRSGSVTFQGLDITNGISLLPVFSPTNLVLVATNVPLSVSPKMNLARNGDSFWLWWPLGYGGFNVQSATNLNVPIAWSPVTPAELNRHTFQSTEPMKFYRMIQP